MDLAAIGYVVVGLVTFVGSMFVAMNTMSEFKQGTDMGDGNKFALFFIGVVSGVFWLAVVPLAALYYGYTWLIKGLLIVNDKRFQEWIIVGEAKWAQILWDSRTKTEVTKKVRCTYCCEPLVRTPTFRGWKPCSKQECLTIFSMDEEAKKQYEVIKQQDERAAMINKPLINPNWTTSPNTTVGGWGNIGINPGGNTGTSTSNKYTITAGSNTNPSNPYSDTSVSYDATATDIQSALESIGSTVAVEEDKIAELSDHYVDTILRAHAKKRA